MDNEFLQSFLKTGLFEIGDSDDRLEKLRKSITDLQKKFEEDYSLLPKYTLVAIDPNISDTEPALLDTEKIVIIHWETLRSKYPEMPRNILRGVILNAINNVGIDDPIAARIIFLTALNLYPFVQLNKEKEIVESLLVKLGDIAEANAVDEWSFIEEEPKLKLSTLKVNDLKINEVTIEKSSLREGLLSGLQAKAPSGHKINHGLHDGNYQPVYLDQTSEGIAKAFNEAFKDVDLSKASETIETSINKFFTTFKKSLDSNLKVAFNSLTSVERRSKLLWWKETLYSSSLRKSYRELNKSLLPVVMSADLNNQLPEVTPISVDYLLRDTLYLLSEKKEVKLKYVDFLTAITEEGAKNILKPFFPEVIEEEGRISVTDFIALLLNDRVNIKDFNSRTGIRDKDESNISEIAVSILHDLLTQRLITE